MSRLLHRIILVCICIPYVACIDATFMHEHELSGEVFDRDLLKLDDPLGSAVVDISAAIPGDAEAVEFSAPLDTQGTVKFAVTTSRTHVARSGHLS